MQVKSIPLPADAESRGVDWPAAGEPSMAELAAIEAELQPQADALDWERFIAELMAEVDAGAVTVGGFGEPVAPSAASVRGWQELSTEALVELVRAGQAEAFDPLYRRYNPQVLRAARNRLFMVYGKSQGADEVAARTWERVLTRIDTFAGASVEGDRFRAWLFGIARHQCFKYVSGALAERPAGAVGDEELYLGGPVVGALPAGEVVEAADKQQMLAQLREGIDELGVDRATVVRLRLDGMQLCDIARQTGWDYRRVVNLFDAAVAQLRDRLLDDDVLFADELAVSRAVQGLPAEQREVVRMRLGGMRECEIVRLTGRSKQAVSSAWRNGRNNLRARLIGARVEQPGTQPINDAVKTRMRAVAESLPAAQREVALLRLDGHRQRDVVHLTSRSPRSVANAWDRARKALTRQGLPACAWAAAPSQGAGLQAAA